MDDDAILTSTQSPMSSLKEPVNTVVIVLVLSRMTVSDQDSPSQVELDELRGTIRTWLIEKFNVLESQIKEVRVRVARDSRRGGRSGREKGSIGIVVDIVMTSDAGAVQADISSKITDGGVSLGAGTWNYQLTEATIATSSPTTTPTLLSTNTPIKGTLSTSRPFGSSDQNIDSNIDATSGDPSDKTRASGGVIAAIVVAVLLLVAITVAVVLWALFRVNRSAKTGIKSGPNDNLHLSATLNANTVDSAKPREQFELSSLRKSVELQQAAGWTVDTDAGTLRSISIRRTNPAMADASLDERSEMASHRTLTTTAPNLTSDQISNNVVKPGRGNSPSARSNYRPQPEESLQQTMTVSVGMGSSGQTEGPDFLTFQQRVTEDMSRRGSGMMLQKPGAQVTPGRSPSTSRRNSFVSALDTIERMERRASAC